jgi:hypothetical protein
VDTGAIGTIGGTKSKMLKTDYAKQASIENLIRLRQQEKQHAPDWVKAYFDTEVVKRLHRARKDHVETGLWFYCKYDNNDCGTTVWWDEVATARIWSQLSAFLDGLDKLPGYSKMNHEQAIEFWQSWQNKSDGWFYNPLIEDPQNPGSWRAGEQDIVSQYKREGVNQKYVVNILNTLGSQPLYKTPAAQLKMPDDTIPLEELEKVIAHGKGQMPGNWGCQLLHIMATRIDGGEAALMPEYERLMSLLLRQCNPQTGMLSVTPDTNINDYGISANNVKGFARIVGYDGLENYPYRNELADSLADVVGGTGIKPAGAIRNYAYLMTLSLQQTDSRAQDLLREIAQIIGRFSESTPSEDGYKWMALSTAATWCNWEIAPFTAFSDPSVTACSNGATRPNRSVVGPFGRWVNVIPKNAGESYRNQDFSWDKHSLRARNYHHQKKRIVEVVPSPTNSQWRWINADPGKNWTNTGFDENKWNRSRPIAEKDEKNLWIRYAFIANLESVDAPYIKAKWNGRFEIYLNGVPVKSLSGEFPEYCGLYVPAAARNALLNGRNVIAVKAINPARKPVIDVGLINWR